MSRIKSFLFGLVALCLSNLSFGQQAAEPAFCKTPGGGILVGGAFTVSPEFGCLDFNKNSATTYASNPISPTGGALTNLGYIFNFKDGGSLTTPQPIQTSITVTAPGNYWILQSGNSGGSQYITCKVFEVIQTEQPEFEITTCGANNVTVTFKDVPKNKQFGKYRIVWGDGGPNGESNSAQVTVYPHAMQHTYASTPASKPQIVGIYTRGASNFTACTSQPISFPVGIESKPHISELEGLNGGASDKITVMDGTDGTAYSIQQKQKGSTWVDTGKKITRSAGSASANQTIDGLDGKQEYCFRLQTKDGCGNETLSNEVCTIIPKATVTSPTSAKIDWNNPDSDIVAAPNVTRYSVGYSESPTGANPNTGAPTPITGTTYVFDLLDCSKKYNFNITAFLGTTATDKVVIKSPNVLVLPSTGGKLPSNFIGTVSIVSKDIIKVSLFEPGNLAFKYIFSRAEGGSSTYTKVSEAKNNYYDDKNVEPDKQQYCYKVEYQDECGNSSEPSPPFCSVFLTSNQPNTLNWTEFDIPDPNNTLQNVQPVEYYVELLDANGSLVKAVDRTPDIKSNVKDIIDQILNDPAAKGQVTFRILARKNVTLIYSGVSMPWPFSVYSNTYTFITPAQIYVPTAFSPNDDNSNDTFTAKGRFIVEYNLVIYDRWGNTIFESKDLETGWNGTTSDGITPAPPGNYGFKIYGLDPAGQKFEKVGSVTLIR